MRRIGWGVIIVLGLILSYRITDNIWGSFAFPFYLQELQYTGDEVAFASKIFGVFMTMAGIAIGAFLFATIGRMPTLLIGAIVAAASNLLYADLAAGRANIDAFARTFGLDAFGHDLRMVRLLIAISGENIAGGLAGAAFVAYLSSITSREFSAVQYALAFVADLPRRLARPRRHRRGDRPDRLRPGVPLHRRDRPDRGRLRRARMDPRGLA